MSDQEYIRDPNRQGRWIPNPKFTGNKFELFKEYPAKLLVDFPKEKLKAGDQVKVSRVPSGQLYLKNRNDQVFGEGLEGTHFELI